MVDRSIGSGQPLPPAPVAEAPVKPLPGAEFAGQPGYYTVRQGDTLIRIGLESGQNWHDIARWNRLDNPNRIEVGQVLRVVPPAAEVSVVDARPVAPASIESRPLDVRPAPGAAAAAPGSQAAAASPRPASAASGATNETPGPGAGRPGPEPAAAKDAELEWAWPAAGSLIEGFGDGHSKGVEIDGSAGDPVYAAADGRVVYAGAGLRGYGNLLIVKHNATYLSAYAHNRALLVKEDQVVRRGQQIAEMGSSDASRVALHFEIRRQGQPIDPVKLLPPR